MGQLKANGRALLSKGVRTRINGRSTNDWSGTERRIIAAAAFGALRFLSGCQKQERVPPVPTEPEVFASPEAAGGSGVQRGEERRFELDADDF